MVIFQLILKVLHLNFLELILLMHLYWQKNSKINKTSNFLVILHWKQVFEKIVRVAWGINCFDPFSDLSCNSAIKNTDLTPELGSQKDVFRTLRTQWHNNSLSFLGSTYGEETEQQSSLNPEPKRWSKKGKKKKDKSKKRESSKDEWSLWMYLCT